MIEFPRLHEWATEDLVLASQLLDDELLKAAPLKPSDYLARQQTLLEQTDHQVSGYARALAAGKISPSQFRQRMTNTLRTAHAAAYRNGASSVVGTTPLSDHDLAQVSRHVGAQLGYLDSFAGDAKDAAGTDAPLSEAYLSNRAGMYADALRSTFWAGTQSQYDQAKYQVRYVCKDDATSCSGCVDADRASPYEVGKAPLPGQVCDGLTNCRCELAYERKPENALLEAADDVALGGALGDELTKADSAQIARTAASASSAAALEAAIADALQVLGPPKAQALAAMDGCLSWDDVLKEHMCWGHPCGGEAGWSAPGQTGDGGGNQVGVSGPIHGASGPQLAAASKWLAESPATTVHHGDAIGVDAQLHQVALSQGKSVVVHPGYNPKAPEDTSKRAFTQGGTVLASKPFLDRNVDVAGQDHLLALPEGPEADFPRSGTWATVRRARAQGTPTTVVWPDGSIAPDQAPLKKAHRCWGYDCGGDGGGGGATGPSSRSVQLRNAKIAAAPRPSAEDIAHNATVIGHSGRAGGDLRGSSTARAVRTAKLLSEFGDGQSCECVWCGQTLTAQTLTQDKIYTATQGGRYRMPNLLPACLHCNQSRNDSSLFPTKAAA